MDNNTIAAMVILATMTLILMAKVIYAVRKARKTGREGKRHDT